MSYSIHTIPVLQDNYVYAITCDNTGDTAIIDCGEASPITDFLGADKFLKSILLTHHHGDHIGGITRLIKGKSDIKIFGNDVDAHRMACVNTPIKVGSEFSILNNLTVQVLGLSGHTIGCVGYYIFELGVCFTGDAVFTMGCGRMFEGAYDMFFDTMTIIKNLPAGTRMYGGHEYTESNILFAKFLMDNPAGFDDYVAELQTLIKNGVPTVPSFVENEVLFNPFLRAKTVAEFEYFRRKKDAF